MAGYTIPASRANRGRFEKEAATALPPTPSPPPRRAPWMPRSLAARPRLLAAILVGLAAGLLFGLTPNPLRWSTRAILSWDLACGFFLTACFVAMSHGAAPEIRRRAQLEDSGGAAILALVLAATVASLGAVAAELSQAKSDKSSFDLARAALVFATVALSWTLVQVIFALHYAHEYYGPGTPGPGPDRGGLKFPGEETPDYWDFMHFSIVIGVAAQTADIAFTSRRQRRIGTVHSIAAFVFNTIVLALSINLLAGLF